MTIPVIPAAPVPPVESWSNSVLPPQGPTLDERRDVIEIDLAKGVRVRVDSFLNEKAYHKLAKRLDRYSDDLCRLELISGSPAGGALVRRRSTNETIGI